MGTWLKLSLPMICTIEAYIIILGLLAFAPAPSETRG